MGSYVLRELAKRDNIVVTALRRAGSKPRIPLGFEPKWLEKPMDELTSDDLKGLSVVIHLASVGVSPQKASWEDLFYWHVYIPTKIFVAAHDAGIRRFVACGTYAEYGEAAEKYDFIPPDAPLEPNFPYAASKAAFFLAARAFCIEKGIELAYLRLFSAFGEGQHDSNFWPSLRRAAREGRSFEMTAGEQVRDFIPVEEAAERLCDAAISQPLVPGKPYVKNLASGHPVTLAEFAQIWWRKWEARGRLCLGALPYRSNEVMRYIPQTDALK